MNRIRLRTGPAALFGAIFLVALLIFLPLRLALAWAGLADYGIAAERVTGTLWGGRVGDVRIGDLSLGTLDARLSPLRLLTGRAQVEVATPGDPASGGIRGAIGSSRHGFFLDDATADVPTGAAFAPLPVTRLRFDGVTIHFADGRCDVASGRVTAVMGGASAGIPLPPTVAGDIRCDGEAVVLPLTGAAGTEGVTMRMEGSGRYRAELHVAGGDPPTVQKLQAAGFAAGPGGYRLAVEGSL